MQGVQSVNGNQQAHMDDSKLIRSIFLILCILNMCIRLSGTQLSVCTSGSRQTGNCESSWFKVVQPWFKMNLKQYLFCIVCLNHSVDTLWAKIVISHSLSAHPKENSPYQHASVCRAPLYWCCRFVRDQKVTSKFLISVILKVVHSVHPRNIHTGLTKIVYSKGKNNTITFV